VQGYHPELVMELVKRGAKIPRNQRNNWGYYGDSFAIRYSTPLIMQCRDLEVMRILLERGENPNDQDDDGCVPLMNCLHGRPDYYHPHGGADIGIRKVLLEKGADVDRQDSLGRSTL
jgi:hypothetical protein